MCVSDDQWPSLLIVWAGMPAAAAVMAAPILKLCPAYSKKLRPAFDREWHTA